MLRTSLDVVVITQIGRPPEEVWSFVSETRNTPAWLGDFASAEHVGAGPPGKGSTVAYTLTSGRSGTYDVVEWEPGRRLAWDGPPLRWLRGGMRPRGSFEFRDLDGDTLFVATYRPELSGTLVLLHPYLKRWLLRQRARDGARLKALLEDRVP